MKVDEHKWMILPPASAKCEDCSDVSLLRSGSPPCSLGFTPKQQCMGLHLDRSIMQKHKDVRMNSDKMKRDLPSMANESSYVSRRVTKRICNSWFKWIGRVLPKDFKLLLYLWRRAVKSKRNLCGINIKHTGLNSGLRTNLFAHEKQVWHSLDQLNPLFEA